MANRDNWFVIGMLFILLGNDSDNWSKYVNYTLGVIFMLASLGNSNRDKETK